MDKDQRSATRATLSEEWKQAQTRVDWMHAPLVDNYVNKLVSGQDLAGGGHWAIYARDRHLRPLSARRRETGGDGSLSMLSLACGSGHIEQFLISALEWPIGSFYGLEYDSALLRAARRGFASIDGCRSEFSSFDFENLGDPPGRFDVVFACHSIHHCADVEGLMTYLDRALAPDGIILGIEFFGPTRFQIEPEVQREIEELFAMLPPHLRRNLAVPEKPIDDRFHRPRLADVVRADPSESVRSSDLRTLLFSTFPTLDVKPMGGTLLRWLLQYRAGNFDPENPSDLCIIQLLMHIERRLIESRQIRSDDLFFVLGPSEVL